MFGHAPPAIAEALARRGQAGLTTMLPAADAAEVSEGLAALFGLPWWQLALTASDANRFALRAARAITGRPRILVFDGCYHGAVDETAVDLAADGTVRPKPSLWGQAFDVTATTRCVPFNDADALRAALAHGDVACVITEPALTNCGIVPPLPGFLDEVRAATRDTGTLQLIDETHTLSTGLGGWTRTHGLEPDIFVAGKAVAGGVPCGVWGFTDAVKAGIDRVRATLPPGHSGVGTTLAGSALQLAALKAALAHLMTADTYARMIAGAEALERELSAVIARHGLPWSVVRIGARLETVHAAAIPHTAAQMRATIDPALEGAIHLGLLNRGYLVTPFHNMLLAGPDLDASAPVGHAAALADVLEALSRPASTAAQPPVLHAV
jgi:glutamate-1-semialdehyde 2,1-aminomutase